MAAPNYTEDLTDVDLAESTTGWSAYGGGGAGLSASPDLSMQGTNCVDKQVTNADKGQYFDNSSGITLGSGDHVFIWHFCGTPGLTDSIQNKGASILVGSASNAYCQYHVEGNDTYGAAGRVARCYPIDYSVRSSNTSPPYRTVTGSPGANPQVFGGGLVTTASVKGANAGIDAIRYGTGAYITAGDSSTPATFDGFATVNDYNDGTNGYNRWGILTKVGGGYELQGYFVIGQNNAGTATAAYFKDSDRNISLVDTVHAASDFTRFLIDHASTEVYWTNINITALGTTNRGYLNVITDPTAFDMVGCTFTGFGTTILSASCTVDGTTWRNSDTVTHTGAALDGCLFDNTISSTAALVSTSATLGSVGSNDPCNFVGDGTTTPGHAVSIGSVTGGGSAGSPLTINWYNTLDNGANQSTWEGSTQASTAGTQGSANSAITMNIAAGTYVKVSVAAGATIPTIQNTGTGYLEITANEVTLTITVKDIDTGSVIEDAMVYVTNAAETQTYINKVETNSSGQVSHTTSLGSAQTLAGKVRAATPGSHAYSKYYKSSPVSGTFSNTQDTDITILLIPDG